MAQRDHVATLEVGPAQAIELARITDSTDLKERLTKGARAVAAKDAPAGAYAYVRLTPCMKVRIGLME